MRRYIEHSIYGVLLLDYRRVFRELELVFHTCNNFTSIFTSIFTAPHEKFGRGCCSHWGSLGLRQCRWARREIDEETCVKIWRTHRCSARICETRSKQHVWEHLNALRRKKSLNDQSRSLIIQIYQATTLKSPAHFIAPPFFCGNVVG